VVVNWYRYKDDGSPWRVNRVKPYNREGGILGTTGHAALDRGERRYHPIRAFRARPLPFPGCAGMDALRRDYPFNLFMQVARAGDPMPRMLTSSAGSIDLNIMGIGHDRARPIDPVGTVLDTAPKSHRALPIRKSDRRANIVELDPGIEIPENERHLWGHAGSRQPRRAGNDLHRPTLTNAAAYQRALWRGGHGGGEGVDRSCGPRCNRLKWTR
jgi:hypothetical protein